MSLSVHTVTTTDQSLLRSVRRTLEGAEEAFLCVAFAQDKGIFLLDQEIRALQERRASARLLVTTTFATTSTSALAMAIQRGVEVKVLNPGSGSTFHPKIYLGRTKRLARAVIASANLTGGLATNVEAAVMLEGSPADEPLAQAWSWAEDLWTDRRVESWLPGRVSGPECIDDDLYDAILAAVGKDPVFHTLGPRPLPNRVVEVTPSHLLVETERSRAEGGGPAEIPAWMLNIAWDFLCTHGTLSNAILLNDLRVHRSSAVCAILARVPGVSHRRSPIVLQFR